MNTPIFDFVENYIADVPVRLHMPGHKGMPGPLRIEPYDITEIEGADVLSQACGIIAESEANAGTLFGCRTLYSTEGSSLCIRAMVFLLKKIALHKGREPRILATRNMHRSFLDAVAALDVAVDWIMPRKGDSYERCDVTGEELSQILSECREEGRMPVAVFVTSPDYLGHTLDIAALTDVCHERGCFLAVDNAHGAYRKFLAESEHPMDFGADLCCDSAHKTLPVLTGGHGEACGSASEGRIPHLRGGALEDYALCRTWLRGRNDSGRPPSGAEHSRGIRGCKACGYDVRRQHHGRRISLCGAGSFGAGPGRGCGKFSRRSHRRFRFRGDRNLGRPCAGTALRANAGGGRLG